jgi:dTDP-4-dehydrorhamnose 3,5-epimerase
MILHELPLAGAYVVESERAADERGFFTRVFGAAEFADAGLDPAVAECSIAYNHKRLTLRGLHFESPPHSAAKLVRCIQGAVYDVIVDLRSHSPTHLGWAARELSAENRLALYVPTGFAHGYLTLTEAAELLYQISLPHVPAAARGIPWDDPAIGVDWPEPPQLISERDASYPYLEDTGVPFEHGL